jgi:hypothetical protein
MFKISEIVFKTHFLNYVDQKRCKAFRKAINLSVEDTRRKKAATVFYIFLVDHFKISESLFYTSFLEIVPIEKM